VSLTVSPILDEAGNTIGASQFARDITEQKRAAELMRETQKLESLGVLAGGIAHDFNNLLVGILGNASLALESLPQSSAERPLIQAVLAAGERAAGLTRQMLAYSGRGQFFLEAIDLSTFVQETIPLIAAAAPRSVKLQLDLASELPPINADATQVQQILMNLVVNGAEAIAQGKPGTVRISTRRMEIDQQFLRAEPDGWRFELTPGDYVLLEVRDDGCGMDERTKSRIFEPFFTTKFTGRGLGLAAALGIVRGHSGSIQVSSSPGNGTTFRVLFPAMTASQHRVVTHEQRRVESKRGLPQKGSVLVIDD
jgi:signal transduction histidine kinase